MGSGQPLDSGSGQPLDSGIGQPLDSAPPTQQPPDMGAPTQQPPWRKWSPMELWLRTQKLQMRGIPSPLSLPRGIIISVLFILGIVSTFFKKLLIVCDHPLPDVTWAKRGRTEGPKWIKCEKCGITILRKNSVRHQKHCKMTTISTKMKPSCRWCKKTSNHLSNIKCHEKICPHRPQFVKKLSPSAVWRIGMKVLFSF